MTSGLLPLRQALVVALAFAVLTLSREASARRNGYFGNCGQCHKDTSGAEVAVTLTPDQFEPGALVRLRVDISGAGVNVGGFFVSVGGVGELMPIGDDTRTNGTQITHTSPKSADNGSVSFEVDWQAPNEPRGVHFQVYGVSANGNNNPSGDGTAGPQTIDRIFGCDGSLFYRDFDGDGYGTDLVPPLLDCSAPAGYAPNGGDCSEDDAQLNPGMQETCNMIDDDCDTRIDEFAAPTCGIGLCMRYAEFCDANAPCFPGDPMLEACNGLDDDCDGVVDQGELCNDDLVCHQAVCKTLDDALAIDPSFVPFQGSEPVVTPTGGAAGSGGSAGGTAGSGGSVAVAPGGAATGGSPPSGGATAGSAPTAAGNSGMNAAAEVAQPACGIAPRTSRGVGASWLLALAFFGLRVRRRRPA